MEKNRFKEKVVRKMGQKQNRVRVRATGLGRRTREEI